MNAIVPLRGVRRAAARPAWRLLLSLAVACAALAREAAASGHRFTAGIRAGDEIVVVNVRPLGGGCDPQLLQERVRVESYAAAEDGRRRWLPTNLQDAFADPQVATMFFVHGNRLTAWEAKCEGLAVYRRLVKRSASDTPIRFVIYSWPSAQIRGPLNDPRVKALRTGPAGVQLAWVVDQLPEETPVTMVGFSFGARIVTGALHLLGGGSLAGHDLGERQHPDRPPVNVVLLGAALHADWLCPGRCHGQAMSQVDQMLLLNNSQDRAMRFYHLSTRHGRPQALGLCGPTCRPSQGAGKLTQRNLAGYVGSNHELFCYLSAPGVTSQLWQYTSE